MYVTSIAVTSSLLDSSCVHTSERIYNFYKDYKDYEDGDTYEIHFLKDNGYFVEKLREKLESKLESYAKDYNRTLDSINALNNY